MALGATSLACREDESLGLAHHRVGSLTGESHRSLVQGKDWGMQGGGLKDHTICSGRDWPGCCGRLQGLPSVALSRALVPPQETGRCWAAGAPGHGASAGPGSRPWPRLARRRFLARPVSSACRLRSWAATFAGGWPCSESARSPVGFLLLLARLGGGAFLKPPPLRGSPESTLSSFRGRVQQRSLRSACGCFKRQLFLLQRSFLIRGLCMVPNVATEGRKGGCLSGPYRAGLSVRDCLPGRVIQSPGRASSGRLLRRRKVRALERGGVGGWPSMGSTEQPQRQAHWQQPPSPPPRLLRGVIK